MRGAPRVGARAERPATQSGRSKARGKGAGERGRSGGELRARVGTGRGTGGEGIWLTVRGRVLEGRARGRGRGRGKGERGTMAKGKAARKGSGHGRGHPDGRRMSELVPKVCASAADGACTMPAPLNAFRDYCLWKRLPFLSGNVKSTAKCVVDHQLRRAAAQFASQSLCQKNSLPRERKVICCPLLSGLCIPFATGSRTAHQREVQVTLGNIFQGDNRAASVALKRCPQLLTVDLTVIFDAFDCLSRTLGSNCAEAAVRAAPAYLASATLKDSLVALKATLGQKGVWPAIQVSACPTNASISPAAVQSTNCCLLLPLGCQSLPLIAAQGGGGFWAGIISWENCLSQESGAIFTW